MKKIAGLALVVAFLVGQPGMLLAEDTKTFTLSASVPKATSVAITASKVVGTTFTTMTGTALSFDPMTFQTTSKIWLPAHYFAVDIAPSNGGSAGTNVTVNYTEGANPNGTGGHGLGWKSTATFMKVVGTTETALTIHGPKKMLKDVIGENILPGEVAGGYLRVYLGIVTKDKAAAYQDPSTSEPFTNADAPGVYDGTITFTATVA